MPEPHELRKLVGFDVWDGPVVSGSDEGLIEFLSSTVALAP
jgi:hypothetical protein